MKPANLSIALLLVLFTAGIVLADEGSTTANPWTVLMEVRAQLGKNAQQAEFRHEFRAPGWDALDEETGKLNIELPFCLRLEYDEPDPKNFLLCGHDFYFWHQGAKKGQLFDVQAERNNGLDLLMLSLDQLQDRYEAHLDEKPAEFTLTLSPLEATAGIQQGELVIVRESMKLKSLSYLTEDGGHNRYVFNQWKEASSPSFEPPTQITWEQQ